MQGRIKAVPTNPEGWWGKIVPILKVWRNVVGQPFYDVPVEKCHDGSDLVVSLSANQLEVLEELKEE